ncbi:unnamed protein product [Darwinula stevensoni]|uniref:DUF7869 domain-containing protein n=1 Tax=Darwinula stevensoni TaxID=69355 RepID=A0A7R9A8Q1_9CRUS|nr:unnamed protein product [Darwinula stevensoni]CAG0896668.1 unnamed protein product [Darwinula stevensoni]
MQTRKNLHQHSQMQDGMILRTLRYILFLWQKQWISKKALGQQNHLMGLLSCPLHKEWNKLQRRQRSHFPKLPRRKPKAEFARAWLMNFLTLHGEHSPCPTKRIYVQGFTMKQLHRNMQEGCVEKGCPRESLLKYVRFTSLLKDMNVSVAKPNAFLSCGICTQIKKQWRVVTGDARRDLEKLRETHLKMAELQRSNYTHHKVLALEDSEWMTMVVDGMDQKKTNVPRFAQEDKHTNSLPKLVTHIAGVMVYTGKGIREFAYVDMSQYPHDSNLTIEVILRTLLRMKEDLKPKLFLQMDNCTRENKNKYLCALAHLLVEEGIFDEVLFNFHPVGHTHEDIDQLFSSVNHYLRVRDTCTVNDLMTCLGEIKGRGRPQHLQAEELDVVHNFKGVIQNHFPRHFRGQTKPHSFRFRKSSGITQMHVRMHAGEAWCPNEHDNQYVRECLGPDLGYICLQTTPELHVFCVLVPPDWNSAGLELVKASIHSYFPEMSEDKIHAWRVFSPDTQQSMEPRLYLQKLRDHKNTSPELNPNITPAMQSYLTNMRSQLLGPFQQPIIGSIGSRRLGICAGTEDLHIGMLAVVYTEEKSSRPWIGKIASIDEKQVAIHWYKGTYEKTWNPMTGAGSISSVPRESLLLWGFTLTDKKQLLRSETREEVRRLYQETDQRMQRHAETSEVN